jgi:hypothetical protein
MPLLASTFWLPNYDLRDHRTECLLQRGEVSVTGLELHVECQAVITGRAQPKTVPQEHREGKMVLPARINVIRLHVAATVVEDLEVALNKEVWC